jgi:hypothetical protein
MGYNGHVKNNRCLVSNCWWWSSWDNNILDIIKTLASVEKKDAMEHTLEYALTLIQKILKPMRLLSIEARLSVLISSSALKETEVITSVSTRYSALVGLPPSSPPSSSSPPGLNLIMPSPRDEIMVKSGSRHGREFSH